MLILLPPSEGKTAPQTGAAVDLESLSHPHLAHARRRVGTVLARVSGQRNALAVLHAGASLAAEVQRNVHLWDAPTAPAARVYTGVLYDAAGANEWTPEQLDRSRDRVRIVSALWGAVSPADHIPAYRLSMGTRLPRIGHLAAFWRQHLGPELDALTANRLVIDCRSSDYMAAWKAPAGAIGVRVEEVRNGKRRVVSHNAKHMRGLLAGALVTAADSPATAEELADFAQGLPGVGAVEVSAGALTIVTA